MLGLHNSSHLPGPYGGGHTSGIFWFRMSETLSGSLVLPSSSPLQLRCRRADSVARSPFRRQVHTLRGPCL